MKITKKDIQLN